MNTEMAHLDVPLEAVIHAADSLQQEGKQVTIAEVRNALGGGSTVAIHKHLNQWRAHRANPFTPPDATLPEALGTVLSRWAQQYAENASAGLRDELATAQSDLETLLESGEALQQERDGLANEAANAAAAREQAQRIADERNEEIERLTAELRNARQIAADALVGKAKDQLAIDGKDAQLADLRTQLERNVASTAGESDARLAAQMELVGVKTERDNLSSEVRELRGQLDASRTERSNLRAELEALRARK